jgi:ATP-dependent DNA helicase Rep
MTLNPPQQQAVLYIDGPLLVVAGAGSGKTRVITEKIAHLIQQCGYSPKSITAVTFTNKSAREMKERVTNLLSKKETRGLKISTFHRLGLNIIRREHLSLNLKPAFTILDTQDTTSLIKDLLVAYKLNTTEEAKKIQWQISNLKNDMIDAEQAINQAETSDEKLTGQIYQQYEQHLSAYNAVDFDDLILKPVKLFQNNSEVREKWQNWIRYLLVDEYQDTNISQYELIRLLTGVRAQFTVVGDDDQSIYAWRGARPENLIKLKEDFNQLKIIKLEQNYRSSKKILRAANTLIKANPHVIQKKLWSDLGEGDDIHAIACDDEFDEAKQCVSMILHHKFHKRTSNNEYAILYRGNHQARVLEKFLREFNVPYFLTGGTSFFSQVEIKDIMAYLRLMVNQDDDSAFLRIINTPRREIGTKTIAKLSHYASERNCSLFNALYEIGLEQVLPARAIQSLRDFADWLNLLADHAQRGDLMANIRQLIRDIDYNNWLIDNCDSKKKAEKRMENVEELLQWLERVSEDKGSLEASVAHLSLLDIMEQSEEEEGGDRIHLMTLHAAKGLEFPYVYIIGMEEEILPHRVSIEQETIEEERRLAYVGITRAQKVLTFLMARHRKMAGEIIECEASRFLDELPQNDLKWTKKGEKSSLSKEEQKEKGKKILGDLKASLLKK